MTNTKKFWPLFPCFHISRSSLRHYHKHITEAKTGQCLKYKFISPTLYIWSVGLVSHHRDVITLLRPHSLYMSQRFCFWKTYLYIAFNSHGRHQMFDEEKCLRLSNLFSWPIPIGRRRACCFSLGTYQNTETMTAFMSLTSIFNCLAINPRWE